MKGDNSFLLDLEGVFEKLKEKGASQDVSLYVEDLLVQQHQRYHNFMTAEADKRRRLLEHVQKLQVIPRSPPAAPQATPRQAPPWTPACRRRGVRLCSVLLLLRPDQ